MWDDKRIIKKKKVSLGRSVPIKQNSINSGSELFCEQNKTKTYNGCRADLQ